MAMVLAGHYVDFIKDYVFAPLGMFISYVAATQLHARPASRASAALAGAVVGGVCALVGIAVSYGMGDVPPEVLWLGTGASTVTGALGGLFPYQRTRSKKA
jgi:hypothetical protein